jgi:hypothetical protein
LANTATYLDITSASGAEHFKGATEPLNTQLFDFADPSDLQIFLDLVLKKSSPGGRGTIWERKVGRSCLRYQTLPSKVHCRIEDHAVFIIHREGRVSATVP